MEDLDKPCSFRPLEGANDYVDANLYRAYAHLRRAIFHLPGDDADVMAMMGSSVESGLKAMMTAYKALKDRKP